MSRVTSLLGMNNLRIKDSYSRGTCAAMTHRTYTTFCQRYLDGGRPLLEQRVVAIITKQRVSAVDVRRHLTEVNACQS